MLDSNGKIILFCDDYKEYTEERGFSLDYFNDIPFVKNETKEDILKEINKPINSLINIGNDFEDFKNKFCLYDSPIASKEYSPFF